MAAKRVDFRRLKEERESQRNKKKIDSPLAKYNSLGQLLCVLCNAPVKSELLWNAHVQSKKHKENLAELKNKKNTNITQPVKKSNTQQLHQKSHPFIKPVEPLPLEKRKSNRQQEEEEENGIPKKKIKAAAENPSSLPADFFDNPSKQVTEEIENLPSDNDDDDDDNNDDNNHDQSGQENRQQTTSSSGLPADFFDKKEKDKTNAEKKLRKPSEEIPEGFFDDPKLDAKARKVEYKDPVEVEWEKFQKEIQMENQVSEALVEEDDEVARIDRQLYELNEQREYFLKANKLRDKQTIIKETIEKAAKEQFKQDDSTSSDSEDFEELFDWRAKKAL